MITNFGSERVLEGTPDTSRDVSGGYQWIVEWQIMIIIGQRLTAIQISKTVLTCIPCIPKLPIANLLEPWMV